MMKVLRHSPCRFSAQIDNKESQSFFPPAAKEFYEVIQNCRGYCARDCVTPFLFVIRITIEFSKLTSLRHFPLEVLFQRHVTSAV